MLGPLNAVRLLASAAYDAVAALIKNAADALREDAKRRMSPPPASNPPRGFVHGSHNTGIDTHDRFPCGSDRFAP
jgi:hypothetical protein